MIIIISICLSVISLCLIFFWFRSIKNQIINHVVMQNIYLSNKIKKLEEKQDELCKLRNAIDSNDVFMRMHTLENQGSGES